MAVKESESWRSIEGWPYEVSSFGRVRRSVQGGSPIAKAGRLLRPHIDEGGYHIVTLCDKPRLQTFKVHYLVCLAFNGVVPLYKEQVRHLDGCPDNNSPYNLCWGTAAENAADRLCHGTDARGERSVLAKFTQVEVDFLRKEHKKASIGRQRVPRGWIQKVAACYGLSTNTISCILDGRGYNRKEVADE